MACNICANDSVEDETANPSSADLNEKPAGDDAIRLQIFLDENHFGPGIIDGKPGRFTLLAVQAWNEANGHPPDDWSAVNQAARAAILEPFIHTIIPQCATEWVDLSLPTSRHLQAKKKRMSYRSYAEFMSERYHCDIDLIGSINPKIKIGSLRPGQALRVPNVTPFEIEKITGESHPKDEQLSTRHVVVDTQVNQVRIFEAAPIALVVPEPGAEPAPTLANRALVASFPITPGQPQFIRKGNWELRNMVEMPWWRYDQQFLDTGVRSKSALNIPPGPNSPVGVIWNGTSKPGIGLHGTSDPETIGRARSAGCIRLANWDAIRLPNLIRPGASVEIR
ncbi:MAG: L,D-transpeptidase family protein [Luteolibacter sp.]